MDDDWSRLYGYREANNGRDVASTSRVPFGADMNEETEKAGDENTDEEELYTLFAGYYSTL